MSFFRTLVENTLGTSVYHLNENHIYNLEGNTFILKPEIKEAVEKAKAEAEAHQIKLESFTNNYSTIETEMLLHLKEKIAALDHNEKDLAPTDRAIQVLCDIDPTQWNSIWDKGDINKIVRGYLDCPSFLEEVVCNAVVLNTAVILGYGIMLDELTALDAGPVVRARFVKKIKGDLLELSSSYHVSNTATVEFDAEESLAEIDDRKHLAIKYTKEDLDFIIEHGLRFGDVRYNSKKVVITSLEQLDDNEVQKAIKKISTVVGAQDIAAFKVKKGLRLNKLRALGDYWHMRHVDLEQAKTYVESLDDNAVVVTIKAHDKSFTTISSTLGRAVASASKQMQTAVMDSLDLDSLI